MNILIMGPAGAGKGTMSELIVKEFGVAHISTGDMLRSQIAKDTELGREAKSYMEGGHLVPDAVINKMVEARLGEDDCQNGYLLDGYPRTLVQAEELAKITERIGHKIDKVIVLEVGFDALAERITGRRICKNCSAIYHIHNKPSKVEGICDVCGSPLTQRSDDTVEQLKVRMDEYDRNTKPVIDFFEKLGVVAHIDASKNAKETFNQVKEALKSVA